MYILIPGHKKSPGSVDDRPLVAAEAAKNTWPLSVSTPCLQENLRVHKKTQIDKNIKNFQQNR